MLTVESISDLHELLGYNKPKHPLITAMNFENANPSETMFFEYEANEALQLSEQERETIERIVKNIENEYSKNIDLYTKELVVSNLELLLNYAKRFYGRQFITRAVVYKDAVTKFEELLNELCTVDIIERSGTPSVKGLVKQWGIHLIIFRTC
ncbi:hypothetical protein ACN92M_15060 [Paenibacillus polymyxa]|uniref:hypothetical protein n=1 Tax=Paenibacillus polymyxa TaxID=1406 RepID=UPI003B5A6B9B